jgi:hypothetical protein
MVCIRLLDISLSRVLGMVAETGTRVERAATKDTATNRSLKGP